MKEVEFFYKGEHYAIPNDWESLNTYQFTELVSDLLSMSIGKLSPGSVRVRYVCRYMGWNIDKITEDSMANVIYLAEQITFPFVIVYPNNDEALSELDQNTYRLCKRINPERLTGVTIARYLARLNYRYAIDLCFCKQFIEAVFLPGKRKPFTGYTIDTKYHMLTSDLTAQQFIEARELVDCTDERLPLLAAILYSPRPYDSNVAHRLSSEFEKLDRNTLEAIRFNFKGFVNYLFTRTEFKLLTAARPGKENAISTGAQETLYSLSSEGYGSLNEVMQMNVIQYLSILRKKIIESVKSLHTAKMDVAQIANTTGLPINIITQIL
jgi:hypothetical protein